MLNAARLVAINSVFVLARTGLTQNHYGAMPCATIHGRYGIYANGDRLWVVGSKHLIDVVSDRLDHELQQRGWESTFAYGQFTICAKDMTDPKRLTTRSQVLLKNYENIEFADRR